jgi:hypothetical protein
VIAPDGVCRPIFGSRRRGAHRESVGQPTQIERVSDFERKTPKPVLAGATGATRTKPASTWHLTTRTEAVYY